MNGFLDRVASDLWDRYGDGVSSLVAVFPSKRASLFFGEALSAIVPRPMWQPASITVEGIAGELSGLVVGDRLRLIAELFKVYREFHPAESFDSFYFWGELLLGDFDSIDKYLVQADALFSNLVDLHALDGMFDYLSPEQRQAIERFWGTFPRGSRSGSENDLSPEQRDFLTVWRTLGPVYHGFRARLRTLGIAYQGMVYREAAEKIVSSEAPPLADRHYVIAGFNALSRCEQIIFDHLKCTSRVDFYWDWDEYFTGDEAQEAGMFMRDNLRRFPPTAPLAGDHDNFRKTKQINSVSAASDVLQCKYAGAVMSELAATTGDKAPTDKAPIDKAPPARPGRETAIVLCDENLLAPLLWSMPPHLDTINITMGYPLRMHPAYTFVERLVELQRRRRLQRPKPRPKSQPQRDECAEERGSVWFYHSDVEGLVRHPYLAGIDPPPAPSYRNFVYVAAARLRTSPMLEKIFSIPGAHPSAPPGTPSVDDWRALSGYLIEVLTMLGDLPSVEGARDHETGGAVGRTSEVLMSIVDHIRRLGASLEACDIDLSTKTYSRLLRRTLQSVRIPFEGEPLGGVQVMGILETRALDFENIVFLSAGDAAMPGNLVGAPSFIPYNLKAAYGLPTPEHHEGVYAYHFFRLMTRARRIDLVWSRTTDEGSPGQPSRYILQLDYESPHTVSHRIVSVDVNLSPPAPIVVEKSARVMALLEEFLQHGGRTLSPSLFSAYVECPLKFYFRGVARLRADDEVSEDIDGAMLGNMLHRAMQLLYTPLVGKPSPGRSIAALVGSEDVEKAVTTAVKELYTGGEDIGPEEWGGRIVLAHKTIVDYINRGILPFDASLPPGFTIEGLERHVATGVSFDTSSGKGMQTAHFSGIADRVDRLADGSLRVVDYKTGNPQNNASALLQMGLYAMMLGHTGHTGTAAPDAPDETSRASAAAVGTRVTPVLYYVRAMSRPGYTSPPVDTANPAGCSSDFQENLRAALAALFDPSVPFTQCADARPCERCDFAPVCRR